MVHSSARQRPAAARAATGLGSDLDLVTRKMRRQRGAGLVGRPLAPFRRDAGGLLTLFDEQFGFGHRHVAIFERQRELTAVDLFRSLAEVGVTSRFVRQTTIWQT